MSSKSLPKISSDITVWFHRLNLHYLKRKHTTHPEIQETSLLPSSVKVDRGGVEIGLCSHESQYDILHENPKGYILCYGEERDDMAEGVGGCCFLFFFIAAPVCYSTFSNSVTDCGILRERCWKLSVKQQVLLFHTLCGFELIEQKSASYPLASG